MDKINNFILDDDEWKDNLEYAETLSEEEKRKHLLAMRLEIDPKHIQIESSDEFSISIEDHTKDITRTEQTVRILEYLVKQFGLKYDDLFSQETQIRRHIKTLREITDIKPSMIESALQIFDAERELVETLIRRDSIKKHFSRFFAYYNVFTDDGANDAVWDRVYESAKERAENDIDDEYSGYFNFDGYAEDEANNACEYRSDYLSSNGSEDMIDDLKDVRYYIYKI